MYERNFIKALCEITTRSKSNVTWAGWTHEYFKEIRLTDYAKTYLKTGNFTLM